MSKFREKAEAQTKQIIGQMLGDEQLVEEGKEESRNAEAGPTDSDSARSGIVKASLQTDVRFRFHVPE